MLKLQTYSSLFLLLLVALPLVYVTALQIHEISNRHQMMERLEKEVLQSISIPTQELIWVKKGKEVLIGKKRFDVKNIVVKNKIAIIIGLFDEEEEAIVKKMNKQHSSQETALLKLWFPIFKNIYKEPTTVTPVSFLKNKYRIYPHLKLPATLLHIITPPPKT